MRELAIERTVDSKEAVTTESHWNAEYVEPTQGKFKIDIDAEIVIPSTTVFPVYEVKKSSFTDEDVKKLIDLYWGEDKRVYIGDAPRTKGQLEALILKNKADISSGRVPKELIPDYEQQIKLFEEEYETCLLYTSQILCYL